MVLTTMGLWHLYISRANRDEAVKDRFISYATSLSSLRRLQVAQLQQVEIFERKSEANLLGTKLKLPDVVVRASIPVEYNFYVDLVEPWTLEMRGEEVVVMAPALRPSTPASNISEMTFEVRKGSLFRNEKEVTDGLQNQISKLLEQRAQSHVSIVREVARKEIEMLVRAWLNLENKSVRPRVYFSDEQIDQERP